MASKSTMKDFHADHHIQPMSLYIKTFVMLTILMAFTIAAAYAGGAFTGIFTKLGLEPVAAAKVSTYVMNAIALGIATMKAYLVVRNFMGVKFVDNVTKLYAILGFFWVNLMCIMWIDYMTRPWEDVKGWENRHPGALPRTPLPAEGEYKDAGVQQPIPPFGQ
jgi:caa(3)-type oxidase subunit IV